MKVDARVRFTKKVILDSFLLLLKQRPLEKITVKKICELAEINRTTFYKYYLDPYDLLQQIEDDTFHTLLELIENLNTKNIECFLNVILNTILENMEFYHCIFYKQNPHAFHEKLILLCNQVLYPQIKFNLKFNSLQEEEWFYYFLIQGSCSILDNWSNYKMKDDIKSVSHFIHVMYHNLMINQSIPL